jgi:hypothetical protein
MSGVMSGFFVRIGIDVALKKTRVTLFQNYHTFIYTTYFYVIVNLYLTMSKKMGRFRLWKNLS